MNSRYPEIVVGGPPRRLGRELGEAAREQIRGFSDIALARVNKSMRISREHALETAHACKRYVETYAPDLLAELEGIAEASGVPMDDIMLLQIRNQLQEEGGCTALAVDGSIMADGLGVVAQNWDNDPALDPFTIVLTRHPDGKPAMMDVTQAGLIAYIGINSAGLGLCMNTLPAPSRTRGVPHYFTVRRIYEGHSLETAVAALEQAERAIPANLVLATPDGPADLEITLEQVCVLRASGDGYLTHTNHCLHPELVAINEEFPELIQSRPRKARMDMLLRTAERPIRVETLERLLCDHQGYPYSICRHANEHATTGFWQTVFSVIAEPQARRLRISRGTPCSGRYEVYEMK